MPTFSSNPLNSKPVHRVLRKHPSLFGIPFVIIIVGASFAMQSFTQTRYDLHDKKVTQVNKEQELGLTKNRKKFDIREEYFRLSATADEEWEPKRIERPKGLPEWGVPPAEPPSKQDKA
ncbi:hypothetical protein DAEQUDRAFT_709686 [Daedalea quercina L-15889]|uniref:Cytochrome c oxidase assembly protein COX16, mitochondrial n=1 Tax=Daedalea quercina L-15889 TaxID=1314783 RepID=A0A165QSP6_9APHY|nr:hypothetical protein DAEQUDRAFT_709686 [Daedalea quercina L-15889]